MPFSHTVSPQLERLLRQLLASEQLKLLIFEALFEGAREWTIAALGLSGFMAPAETERVLADPTPFVVCRALERSLAGDGVFLDTVEVGRANAEAGLDLVAEYLPAIWEPDILIWRQVAAVAHDAFKTHHRGYRLNRVLEEGWAEHAGFFLDAGYRAWHSCDVPHADLDRLESKHGSRRTLFYADRSVARGRAPGLPSAHVLQYAPPRCRFTPAEQRTLRSASDGLTDPEIARQLGVSSNAIKLAWRSIYARVHEHAAFVLGDGSSDGIDGRRGPEKRRRVLAYVRDNPEELRPFLDRS